MKTNHMFAAISIATALAVIAPAYAGGLGGWLGGGIGGGLSGMGGMNRLGSASGQGAFQGQGSLKNGSLDKPKLPKTTTVAKQTSASGATAPQSTQSTAAAAK